MTPVKRYDFTGDLLPREETSLGPVDYRRTPSRRTRWATSRRRRQARHAPTVETSFVVPALTALGTAAGADDGGAGRWRWAFGWPGKTVSIVFALCLALGWFWRLGFADKVLWSVESWTGKDLDHDHSIGRPALQFATVNGGAARATVARQTAQNDTEARQQALQAFCDVCYLHGTSEGAHGITASGPDRVNYVACRDELMRLGLARGRIPTGRGRVGHGRGPGDVQGIVAGHVA